MFSYMLAPLEDYSDNALRTLCFRHGADLTFTEMAWVEAIVRRNKPTLAKTTVLDSTPVQIQLLAGKENELEKFLANFSPFPSFKGFNLNLCCPSNKVMREGRGAAMVKRIAKNQRIVSIIKKHGFPVSAKILLGASEVERRHKVYLHLIESIEADFFVVCGKHAMQKSRSPADDTVYPECVEAAKGIPIIANGGIDCKKKVEKLKKMGVSGVMIGRPAVKNPAIFDFLKDKPVPSIEEIRKEYLELSAKFNTRLKYRENVLKKLGTE